MPAQITIGDLWYWLLLVPIACYFIGCFNFAVLISHKKNKDVRQMGSGNPGTMNMTREFGLGIGALTLFCDLLKGGLPVLLMYFLFKDSVFEGTDVVVGDFMRYYAGIFVVVGHIYPVTMGFKGGKGIGSTIGVFLFGVSSEAWWVVFLMFFVYGGTTIAYIVFTEWGSMGSLYAVSVGAGVQAIIFYLRYLTCLTNPWAIGMMLCLLVLCILTWYAHRANIARLLSGEEHHTSVRKKKKA